MVNNKQNASSRTRLLILSGVFAAVTAVCSWISIPLPFTPVPINLALLGVYLSGGLLGGHYGFYSQLIYVLLGAIGVPVFAGFSGGFGIISGPTGGYIIGYVFAAIVVGLVVSGGDRAAAGRAGQTGTAAAGHADAADHTGATKAANAADHTGASRHTDRLSGANRGLLRTAIACILGMLVCYAFGTVWYVLLTGTGMWTALALCVFPFLPGDAIKIVLAVILIRRLKTVVWRQC